MCYLQPVDWGEDLPWSATRKEPPRWHVFCLEKRKVPWIQLPNHDQGQSSSHTSLRTRPEVSIAHPFARCTHVHSLSYTSMTYRYKYADDVAADKVGIFVCIHDVHLHILYDAHFKPTHSLKTKYYGSPNKGKRKQQESWIMTPSYTWCPPPACLGSNQLMEGEITTVHTAPSQTIAGTKIHLKDLKFERGWNLSSKKPSSQSPDCQLEICTRKLKLFQHV